MNWRLLGAALAAAAALAAVCLGWQIWRKGASPPAAPLLSAAALKLQTFEIYFEERQDTGVDFLHSCGHGDKYFFPEIMGSGVALLDYNRDERLDIFAVQGAPAPDSSRGSPTSRLYRQESDGRFRDVTEEAGLADDQPYGMGVAVGDINNDGWPDLYVTKFGPDRLWLNEKGQFRDITDGSGISNPRWGASAGFFDFDRDGWLDLFVTNYVDYYPSQRCVQPNGTEDYCHPAAFSDAPARLFRNLTGDPPAASTGICFRDVSLESNIESKPGPGLGVLFDDFSGDGWLDIYVANDGKANFLWENQKNGTFREEAIAAGAAYDRAARPQANMGIACGDIDGNGLRDLLVTHIDGEYDTLYLQLAEGIFEDRSIEAGLRTTIPPTGFGTTFGDWDLDGDEDLAVVNGRVRRPPTSREAPADRTTFWHPYAESNALFINQGHGAFLEGDSASQPFCAGCRVSRGLAMGDLDNDGDLDLVTSEIDGPARIFWNIAPRQGNWLLIRAIEPQWGGRDAYGAAISIQAGGRRFLRTVSPAGSYLSSSDPRAHFGLGAADTVESVHIRWPDGSVESFRGSSVNRQLALEHGKGFAP